MKAGDLIYTTQTQAIHIYMYISKRPCTDKHFASMGTTFDKYRLFNMRTGEFIECVLTPKVFGDFYKPIENIGKVP